MEEHVLSNDHFETLRTDIRENQQLCVFCYTFVEEECWNDCSRNHTKDVRTGKRSFLNFTYAFLLTYM